jgi:hypothetical protein
MKMGTNSLRLRNQRVSYEILSQPAPGSASRSMPPTCGCPRRAAALRQDTDAGGAIGREALEAATVASGAKIKPGEAFPREALDAGAVPRPSTRQAAAPGPLPVGRSAARPSMPAGAIRTCALPG